MTEITQADKDAAAKYWEECGISSLASHFAAHRQIEITDAMIEAGAAVERNAQAFKDCRALAKAVFNAMMGAR